MRRLVASDAFWCVLLVVTMLAGIGYIILDTFVGPPTVAMAVEMEEPRPKTHQVMPGDTLWGIASQYYPGEHTGEMVFRIRELNGLTESATIYPYEVLKLP